MFPSIFYPSNRRRQRRPPDHSPFSSAYADSPVAERRGYFARRPSSNAVDSQPCSNDERDEEDEDGEDGREETSPLLPIFSAAELDSIPVYNLVHSIRAEVVSRVGDVSLTWEQLRTPQVSSFVVKPVHASLLRGPDKVSRGMLYCLMANCLQFRKEAQEMPATAGTSTTRALLAELLAIKLLKEFTPRELIDALSYDFYPLQGLQPATASSSTPIVGNQLSDIPLPRRASRISALEIAVRANAKKLLSHPLVSQHLSEIWAGNVLFHSIDQIHKNPDAPFRRTATLYDPRDASLFKLSRLRVPRYRHISSTFSLVILLFLHILVLMERSSAITPLEIMFWVWSFGFMIDEITDFNEAGVIYFMSLWNSFDMGIFLLFVTFYVMRIVGLLLPHERPAITDWSYDILGCTAVLLFPRIFSVLDHYRYFSQLIIAFRIMAVDMAALLVLIVVSCSGFLVAFLSFARDDTSVSDVSYSLFQILMGFSPAAWETWSKYNILGRMTLASFLIITHFLIVTILVTVLTNSFARVVANAQEEHQFLVAVNTISLVKNQGQSLFSYVAPANLLAWLCHPLRHFMSFKSFIKLNRTIIKLTHFPILFMIFVFEKIVLQKSAFSPDDVQLKKKASRPVLGAPPEVLMPAIRKLRRDSVDSHQQEALEEVFRRPYRGNTMRTDKSGFSRGGRNVDNWMNGVMASSPTETDQFGTTKRPLWKENPAFSRLRGRDSYGTLQRTQRGLPLRDFSMTRSVISDPEDFAVTTGAYRDRSTSELTELYEFRTEDDDADNEENSAEDETNDDGGSLQESLTETPAESVTPIRSMDFAQVPELRLPSIPSTPSNKVRVVSPAAVFSSRPGRGNRSSRHHSRTNSSQTILFNPPDAGDSSDEDDLVPRKTGQRTPGGNSSGRKTPRSRPQTAARSRPIMPPRQQFQSAPNISHFRMMSDSEDPRRPSSVVADIDHHDIAVPSSFATQMAIANGQGGNSDLLLNRIMLARMGALEQSVKDVKELLKEVKTKNEEDMRGRKREGK